MPLHNLNSVTIGVPDVKAVRSYYEDFGLTGEDGGWMSTADGGNQLRLMRSASTTPTTSPASPLNSGASTSPSPTWPRTR